MRFSPLWGYPWRRERVFSLGGTMRLSPLRRTLYLILAVVAAGASLRQAWAAPETGRTVFSGEIRRGETFSRPLPGGLAFHLVPESQNLGWQIVVSPASGPEENFARYTPPFHFVPNPRFIEGWHFRNADNTGPNAVGEKNVNAPQKIRDFIFSPDVGHGIDWPLTQDDVERIARDGRGALEITGLELGNLIPGERAWIESMRFRVEIHRGVEARAK